jgi:hypothetical protein
VVYEDPEFDADDQELIDADQGSHENEISEPSVVTTETECGSISLSTSEFTNVTACGSIAITEDFPRLSFSVSVVNSDVDREMLPHSVSFVITEDFPRLSFSVSVVNSDVEREMLPHSVS